VTYRRPFHRALLLAAMSSLVLAAAGCEPLVNAPPGGGSTVTETFLLGPFAIGPGGDAMGSPSNVPRPAGAFGIKRVSFDVVDAAGKPVSMHDVHLHHLVMTTDARQDALCSGRAERFMGAGMERTPLNLWGPYTYLVGAGDRWGAIYHVMNTSSATRTVYIKYRIEYQPGADAGNSRPVRPLFMDVTGCGNSEYDVPGNGGPGSVHTKSRTWTAPQDGMAVYAGGHVHDGGIDISLQKEGAGSAACTGTASYHENPRHLAKINPCFLHEKVSAGDRFTVTSRYDNSAPVEGAMGIMLSYVWWGTQ
jgi:hypothetical protein